MQPDLPAPLADRNDATVRATGKTLTGLDVQNQACRGRGDGRTWMPSTPSSASARVHHRPPERDKELFHVRVSFGYWLLGRYQFKETLTSFPPHSAAPKTVGPAGGTFKPP